MPTPAVIPARCAPARCPGRPPEGPGQSRFDWTGRRVPRARVDSGGRALPGSNTAGDMDAINAVMAATGPE